MKHLEEQKATLFLLSIYKKAWKDKLFLHSLVKEPIKTLNDFTGEKGVLPIGKKLVVEDQTNPNQIFLNIPAKPVNYYSSELKEEELDKITGAFKSYTNFLLM